MPVRSCIASAAVLSVLVACSGTESGSDGGSDAGAAGAPPVTGGATSQTGGAGPTGGTAPTGGVAPTGGAGPTGGTAPAGGAGPTGGVVGWAGAPPVTDGVNVRVRNLCPFPLWIHGAGNPGTLEPDDAELVTGQSQDYVAPTEWTAARVTAYSQGPRQGEIEKAEITITGGVLNYNVTYVDWVGLPLEIVGLGGDCNAADSTTGCYAPMSDILSGCPETFLLDANRCLAPRSYCLNPANQANAFCHALDGAIASCAQCPAATTPEVYACNGPYTNEARWCAALNRGMVSDPDNADQGLYYQTAPYNTYAKWVHQVCPNIYAFPYDDWLSHGGFRACAGNEIRITFCPSG
jgi:hypothetical protein